jgi:sterol desaturase/sphingolipid hydroxylase (fatty acid hydroxylase superfamily)
METFINWILKSSEDFQFFIYFVLLFLLIIAEQFLHLRPLKRKGRWLPNFSMTTIVIVTLMAMPMSFFSIARYAEVKQWGLLNNIQLNWIIEALMTLLLRGFISFFTHYLNHKIPFLWRIHRVHHLDTELDVSTNVRFHPLEFIVNIFIGAPIILVFGFPVWVLMFYELIDVVITLFSHANVSLPRKLENALRYIIVTPDLHRVHHSSYQPETDSNFSATFPIWDIIFGTYKTTLRVPQKEMEIGLKEVRDERTNNVIWLLLSPFKSFKTKSTIER